MKFEDMIAFVPIVLLIGLSTYIAYGIWLLIASLLKDFWRGIEFSLMNKKNISQFSKYEIHLLHRFPYYDRLPEQLKAKFLLRVKRFISDKSFEGREDLVITD